MCESPEDLARVQALLKGSADAVISDMAAASTGHSQTDHMRVMDLIATSFDFAAKVLRPGIFIAKTLRGGSDTELLNALKKAFTKVRHIKPAPAAMIQKRLFGRHRL